MAVTCGSGSYGWWRIKGNLFGHSARILRTIGAVLIYMSIPISETAFAARISDEAWRMEAQAIISNLDYKQGQVWLHGTNARIEVPWNFSFLGADDAEQVLVKIWGNPPGTGVLGLLVPRDTEFTSSRAWAAVIQYLPDGYVEAEGFAGIDFGQLLVEMQQATRLASLERERAGFAGLELVGWAQRPLIDNDKNAILWAKEFANPADDTRTLNYNVRLLGRAGVLVLTAIAPMNSYDEVAVAMNEVLGIISFVSEWQYSDLERSQDLAAPYNIRGLISENLAPVKRDYQMLMGWPLFALVFIAVLLIVLFRLRRTAT